MCYSCSLMFALGMFCCWEAALVSSVDVSGVLIMSLPRCLYLAWIFILDVPFVKF
ncbi:hypothetical protein RHMOL_Rhmol05G0144400 [Rhododendron molle]|uniref:Uncharacterized protein n=1 Tax=Rhododendron molle TaxID=49168 RepID=A0ACC0NNW2_RHOML|nr:hypothetical protein RHMOL_Rhmol05G0144400 [Rhododendron molle]